MDLQVLQTPPHPHLGSKAYQWFGVYVAEWADPETALIVRNPLQARSSELSHLFTFRRSSSVQVNR